MKKILFLILGIFIMMILFSGMACKEKLDGDEQKVCLVTQINVEPTWPEVTYTYDALGRVTSISYPGDNVINLFYGDNKIMVTIAGEWDLYYTSGVLELNADGYITEATFNTGAKEFYTYNADGYLIKFELDSEVNSRDFSIEYFVSDGNIVGGVRTNHQSGEISVIHFEYYTDLLNPNGLFDFIQSEDIQPFLPYGAPTKNLLKSAVRTFSDNEEEFRNYEYVMEAGYPRQILISSKKKEDTTATNYTCKLEYSCE